jgi:aspartokinase-like uncharacterized kinase
MDAVIKVGGSLAEDHARLMALCTTLSALAENYELMVVPGGGKFADVVRDLDKRFNLPSVVSHRMAILGMDQFGLLLSDFVPNSQVIRRLEAAKVTSEAKNVPIFLPSQLMFQEDPLENSWEVTSDSIAAYLAGRLHAGKLVLVTDVDGVFTLDPKKNKDAVLIEQMSAKELYNLNKRTSVDRFLPKLLLDAQLDCYVVNGWYPERVEAVLAGQSVTCTFVFART